MSNKYFIFYAKLFNISDGIYSCAVENKNEDEETVFDECHMKSCFLKMKHECLIRRT